jgi:O-antigen ligase
MNFARQTTATLDREQIAPEDLPTIRMASMPGLRILAPEPAAMVAWIIPFALIVYLGMTRGGFEQTTRGEIGIAAWWLVAVGLISVALPRARVGTKGWIGLGLLAAFAGWTALGISWSESSGRSVIEVSRVVTYVGVFAGALLLGGRDRLRSTAGAVGAACAVIAGVALLSRLHPSWFPSDDLSEVVVGIEGRLRYPVGYWNALAGLIAIGLPLVIWGALAARSLPLRGLSAAAIPVMALAMYFTYSRAGLAATAIALIAFIALSERRLSLLPTLAALGLGSAVVVWQGANRGDLADGLTTSTAVSQGTEMIWIVLGVCLLTGLAVAGLAAAEDRGSLPLIPEVPRRTALRIGAVTLLVALVAFVGFGGPGRVADGFDEFKQPAGLSDTSTRLSSVGGNGRWQYWSAAVDAFDSAPVTGIGPGTYIFWWSEHRDTSGLIHDAHSLFVETLGELGIVGLLLIAGLVLFVIGLGVQRVIRSFGEQRAVLAGLTASALAFAVAAGLDWLWELAVIPVAFLFVAAAILSGDIDDEPVPHRAGEASLPRSRWRRGLPTAARVAGALAAIGAILVIADPMITAQRITQSQEAFAAGDYAGALSKAESAADLESYSAAPWTQEAFAYEAEGQLSRAATAARAATERESTNWETWYLLSRIQAQRGKEGPALVALRQAQDLNPFSQLLNPIRCGAEGKLCQNATPAP